MHDQQNIQFSYFTFWKYVITRINFDIVRFHWCKICRTKYHPNCQVLYRNTEGYDMNAFHIYNLRYTRSWLLTSEANTPRPTTSSDILKTWTPRIHFNFDPPCIVRDLEFFTYFPRCNVHSQMHRRVLQIKTSSVLGSNWNSIQSKFEVLINVLSPLRLASFHILRISW